MGASPSAPGARPTVARDYKFLIIGETGAGKTSFLNYLCNLPSLVQEREKQKQGDLSAYEGWDKKSFNRQNLEQGDEGDQSSSKTHAASVYHIAGFGQRFLAIDTPGLGDTRGKATDDQHIQSIEKTIIEQDYINAICLVINGKVPRAGPQIQYVLSRLAVLLPKEVIDQIVVVFSRTESWDFLEFDLGQFEDLLQQPIPEDNMFCFDNPYAYKDSKKGKGKGKYDEKSARMIKAKFADSIQDVSEFFQKIKDFCPVESNCFKQLFEAKDSCEKLTMALSQKLMKIAQLEACVQSEKKALALISHSQKQSETTSLAQLKTKAQLTVKAHSETRSLAQLNDSLRKLKCEKQEVKYCLAQCLLDFQGQSTASSYEKILQKQKAFMLVAIDQKASDLTISDDGRSSMIYALKEQVRLLDEQLQLLTDKDFSLQRFTDINESMVSQAKATQIPVDQANFKMANVMVEMQNKLKARGGA